MLARHLRSRVLAHRSAAHVVGRSSPSPFVRHGPVASFHASAPRRSEQPKSPYQTFVEVLREELRKNRELQDNMKQLQGDVDKLQDSEAMKRAKDMYERARVG